MEVNANGIGADLGIAAAEIEALSLAVFQKAVPAMIGFTFGFNFLGHLGAPNFDEDADDKDKTA